MRQARSHPRVLVSEPALNYSPGGNVVASLTASYTYDNEGRITATQYPSSWNGSWVAGPNIGNTFDSMGRLQKVTDLGASSDIISNATYNPMGQLLTMTAGYYTGISETRSYNSIGQLTAISSCVNSYGTCTPTLNAQYNYPATQNNGKIASQYDGLSGETVTYLYDSLNRLASASGYGWGQSYNYDGFGNLTDQNVTSGTAPALHVTYDPSTNRQTGGECADANGNLNAESTAPPCWSGYNYDVENRIVAQTPVWGGAPSVAYAYNASNKRIWKGTGYTYDSQTLKTTASNDELTFWSITGQKLCTYSLTQNPGGPDTPPQLVVAQTAVNYYFGGRLIKNSTGYVTPDRLGSIGKYFPYGVERPSATTDGKEKFATYFRDSETGLDYADQRYHQPGMGRFMTTDRLTGHPSDPGTWNKYSYTAGDPVNRVDTGGNAFCGIDALNGGVPLSDQCNGNTGACVSGNDPSNCLAEIIAIEEAGDGTCGGGVDAFGDALYGDGSSDPSCGGVPTQTVQNPPPPSCDDLLGQWIDQYLASYRGMTGRGSPLSSLGGSYFVALGEQTGIDPAFILGIARSESSLATNPNVRGGKFNVYGNSTHFSNNLYTNYTAPTMDAFNLISSYVARGVGLDTGSMYRRYEGESSTLPAAFARQLGTLNGTDSALFGNLNNVKFNCDGTRRAQLAAALGVQ